MNEEPRQRDPSTTARDAFFEQERAARRARGMQPMPEGPSRETGPRRLREGERALPDANPFALLTRMQGYPGAPEMRFTVDVASARGPRGEAVGSRRVVFDRYDDLQAFVRENADAILDRQALASGQVPFRVEWDPKIAQWSDARTLTAEQKQAEEAMFDRMSEDAMRLETFGLDPERFQTPMTAPAGTPGAARVLPKPTADDVDAMFSAPAKRALPQAERLKLQAVLGYQIQQWSNHLRIPLNHIDFLGIDMNDPTAWAERTDAVRKLRREYERDTRLPSDKQGDFLQRLEHLFGRRS